MARGPAPTGTARQQVIGEDLEVVRTDRGHLDRVRDLPVHPRSTERRDPVEKHLPHERVAEPH